MFNKKELNEYDTIIIGKNNIIITKQNEKIKIPFSKKDEFLNTIYSLSNEEIISEIIRTFIQSNTINCISNNGNNLEICSYNKKLIINNSLIDKNKKDSILNKYIYDRNNVTKERNNKKYEFFFDSQESSYTIMNNYTIYTFKTNNGKVNNIERKFIKKKIDDIFDNEKIIVKKSISKDTLDIEYHLVSANNIEISYDADYKEYMKSIIEEHNLEIEKSSMLQLKMEGF